MTACRVRTRERFISWVKSFSFRYHHQLWDLRGLPWTVITKMVGYRWKASSLFESCFGSWSVPLTIWMNTSMMGPFFLLLSSSHIHACSLRSPFIPNHFRYSSSR
jgi:hypothetical protein